MENIPKRRLQAIFIVAILLVIAISTLSYALWTKGFEQDDKNKLTTTNCFDITFASEKEVIMENAFPQTDAEGLTNDPFKVTMTNECDIPISYEVILNDLTDSTLEESNVMAAVGDEIISLKNAPEVTTTGSGIKKSLKINTGFMPGKGQRTLLIRTWMEENTSQDEGSNTIFKYKIDINATTFNSPGKYLANEILSKNPIQISGDINFYNGSPFCSDYDYSTYECFTYDPNGTGLNIAPDDDGTSYYFRGTVENNNVQFADMNWKILRINGDGSVRLVLKETTGTDSAFNSYEYSEMSRREYAGFTYDNDEGKECTKEHPCEVTYDKGNNNFSNDNFGGDNSTIKNALETWYKENLVSYDDKIVYGLFCNDVSYGRGDDDSYSYVYYGAAARSDKNLILICPDQVDINGKPRTYGGLYKTKIGLITYDELVMAGYSIEFGYNFNKTNYLYRKASFWSMTPYTGSDVFTGGDGYASSYNTLSSNNTIGVVPVINLKPDVKFTLEGTGDPGTESNPYIIQ